MSTSLGARGTEESREARTPGGAATLALAEFKRGWTSWLHTILGTLFLAVTGGAAVAGPFLLDWTGSFPTAVSDFFMILVCTCLAYNWADGRYFRLWQDPFADRLRFLRALPVPARDLVLGRILTMAFGLLVLTPVFFLPPYLFTILDGAPPQPTAYAYYALIWAGYGLFSGGMMLYLELGFHGKVAYALVLAWMVVLIVVFVLLRFVLDVRVAAGIAELARTYGPLPALVSLLVGATALGVFGLVATRRLRWRELA